MGDVIKKFPVRTYEGEKPRRLRLYFDTGSPYTFIKRSACRGFENVLLLRKGMSFGGLGDGKFRATHGAFLEVRLLGIWCRHAAYVVDDSVLTKNEDLLVGHDFMQKFDVDINSKGKNVVLRRTSLQSAQIVRRLRANGERSVCCNGVDKVSIVTDGFPFGVTICPLKPSRPPRQDPRPPRPRRGLRS